MENKQGYIQKTESSDFEGRQLQLQDLSVKRQVSLTKFTLRPNQSQEFQEVLSSTTNPTKQESLEQDSELKQRMKDLAKQIYDKKKYEFTRLTELGKIDSKSETFELILEAEGSRWVEENADEQLINLFKQQSKTVLVQERLAIIICAIIKRLHYRDERIKKNELKTESQNVYTQEENLSTQNNMTALERNKKEFLQMKQQMGYESMTYFAPIKLKLFEAVNYKDHPQFGSPVRYNSHFLYTLQQLSKRIGNLKINIPESIILGFGFPTPTFVYNDPQGFIRFQQDLNFEQVAKKYREINELKVPSYLENVEDQMPKAIMRQEFTNQTGRKIDDMMEMEITRESNLIKGDEVLAKIKQKLSEISENPPHMFIQRIIIPKGLKAFKIRIILNNRQDGPTFKSYMITSKQRMDGKQDSDPQESALSRVGVDVSATNNLPNGIQWTTLELIRNKKGIEPFTPLTNLTDLDSPRAIKYKSTLGTQNQKKHQVTSIESLQTNESKKKYDKQSEQTTINPLQQNDTELNQKAQLQTITISQPVIKDDQ